MAQTQPTNDEFSTDDFYGVMFVIIGILVLLFFFGKDLILGYWKALSFLWFSILAAFHPGGSMATALHHLDEFTVPQVSWRDADQFNRAVSWYFSVGKVQLWPIFWAILPAAVAFPLLKKGKNLKKTFAQPWDLALYLSGHFPWMLPVIRERGKLLKNRFADRKKQSVADRLNRLVQRERISDWARHPLEILLDIGAFEKVPPKTKGALETKHHGWWRISDSAVSRWTEKQLGAKAGRMGFSTPERNALFHAFVSDHPMMVLKRYAAGGDRAIRKMGSLPAKDWPAFQKYRARHAFETTILLSALADARRKGIVPPRWFVWLKYRDRALWYALHGLGMPRPHSEGLPGLVQWHCERKLQAPVEVPQSPFVKSGLVDALEEVLWEESPKWKAFVKQAG